MRQIGQVAENSDGGRLLAVLAGHGVAARMDEDRALWIEDDAQLEVARELSEAYQRDPVSARMLEAAARGEAKARARREADTVWRQRGVRAQHELHGVHGRGWTTLGLMVVSLFVAAASSFGGDLERLGPLFLTEFPAGAALPEVRSGQIWRLFTPIVIHYGILHLAFNLINWWSFGQTVETFRGARFMIPFVLVTAALSNVGEVAWSGWAHPNQVSLVGGLSGVLYGVFGYAWRRGQIDPRDPIAPPPATVQNLMIWLVLCMSGALGNVANAAHVIGLLVGLLWAQVERWRR